jgi:hydroxyethylthiazole kinase-like uncharacterized protein yjeF
MQKVLTAAEMREVDRLTTQKYGIPSILLMENAAHAVASVITEKLGGSVKGKSILVLCGKGNNGGDGAALARILGMQGAVVDVLLFGKISETKGDARINFGVLCAENFEFDDVYFGSFGELREIRSKEEWVEYYLHIGQHREVYVDALFGTGLSRPLDIWLGNIVHDINFINEDPTITHRITISVDLPSGLDADSGTTLGETIQADITVTFTAPKPGNVLAPASSHNGELIVADIGSPLSLIEDQPSKLYVTEKQDAANWLYQSAFSPDSYKNKRGHTVLIAGSESYSGAAVLAGNAAMRSGVGLVTLVTPKASMPSVAGRILPEVMIRGAAETESGAISELALDEIGDLLEKADAVAVGCGLSQNESTKLFVKRLVEGRRQPLVVDADALNLLAPFDEGGNSAHVRKDSLSLILTPHDGEFMRLLGIDDKELLIDRVAAVREYSQKHNVILVLKGERVLIGEPGGKVVVNPTGNSGLGKAGNGDTLTGILAGFVTQAAAMRIDIFETVVAAVYIAGLAGNIAEKKFGKRVMTASDVRDCLAEAFESLTPVKA